jgi:hypothetical protein
MPSDVGFNTARVNWDDHPLRRFVPLAFMSGPVSAAISRDAHGPDKAILRNELALVARFQGARNSNSKVQ